jgi:hypothetical protein
MHRNYGVVVRAEELRAFHADGPVTERGAFGGTGHNTNVQGHTFRILRELLVVIYTIAATELVSLRSDPDFVWVLFSVA